MKYSLALTTLIALGVQARQALGSITISRDTLIGKLDGNFVTSDARNRTIATLSQSREESDQEEGKKNRQGNVNTSFMLSSMFATFIIMKHVSIKSKTTTRSNDGKASYNLSEIETRIKRKCTHNTSAFQNNGNDVLNKTYISLMDQFVRHSNSIIQSPPTQNDKAVDFVSPKEIIDNFFDLSQKKDSSCSMSLDNDKYNNISPQEMTQLFDQIRKYSVNTSHPYFFNQLFGALDPVALAAELVALSVHTSPYTWETAPIMTMIEREVMSKLGKLVFERDQLCKPKAAQHSPFCSYDELLNNKYDGLMLPGGSMSNLTGIHLARHYCFYGNKSVTKEVNKKRKRPRLVAFVSREAHYSFKKAAAVTGIGNENLISVPTLMNGQMDVEKLDALLGEFHNKTGSLPFMVAATAGSTVRGSFDDIAAIVSVCKKHENIINNKRGRHCKIWIHVDGAWGGSTIFSSRPDVMQLMNGVQDADSFTFNPHKFLGAPQQTTAFITRHKGVLKAVNSCESKYLFDPRKNGAEFDLGDGTFTCGRKSDAIKLWAQWKYYGSEGIASMVEKKIDSLRIFIEMIRHHDSLMFACNPWPLNVNFFYLPERLRRKMIVRGVEMTSENPSIPDDISEDLANVSVKLKLKLHRSGEMILPFQPLSNQKADCFRLVLAGNKTFAIGDYERVIELLEKYGADL